jgi:hypothetical protein
MRTRWTALVRCFDDGRLALDNNPAERALRCVAIGRKNYLFAGSDAGGRRAAAIYSLIESAKLNGPNPQHYIADVLARIADHPARRIAELLPWNCHRLSRPARRALTERLPSDSKPAPSETKTHLCAPELFGDRRGERTSGTWITTSRCACEHRRIERDDNATWVGRVVSEKFSKSR